MSKCCASGRSRTRALSWPTHTHAQRGFPWDRDADVVAQALLSWPVWECWPRTVLRWAVHGRLTICGERNGPWTPTCSSWLSCWFFCSVAAASIGSGGGSGVLRPSPPYREPICRLFRAGLAVVTKRPRADWAARPRLLDAVCVDGPHRRLNGLVAWTGYSSRAVPRPAPWVVFSVSRRTRLRGRSRRCGRAPVLVQREDDLGGLRP